MALFSVFLMESSGPCWGDIAKILRVFSPTDFQISLSLWYFFTLTILKQHVFSFEDTFLLLMLKDILGH